MGVFEGYVSRGNCMRLSLKLLVLAQVAVSTALYAGSRDVQYGPKPSWVLSPPLATSGAAPDGAPVRVVYNDNQSRLSDRGTEIYSAYRMKILAPEALDAGKIQLNWDPGGGDVTVHALNIVRDGKSIDVLSATKFTVLQREERLEESMLDGQLTATMQVPGLRVGDEIEFAVTIRERDPTLGNHFYGVSQLPLAELPGAFRARLIWPQAQSVRWQVTPDLKGIQPTAKNGQTELSYELRDPKPVVLTEGAPARINVRRYLEYTDFSSWGEVSRQFWPLFERASKLEASSPLRVEAAKIASTTQDPTERVLAALKLVEGQIRYVYVGLDAGNYTPASADETWSRRFGDCKAKAALLLALLRELGVPGEAVLVNATANDGMNERLPTPAVFNHVVVRTKVGDRSYWLDGTRLGDQYLSLLPPPPYRWVLPVRPGAAELESVPLIPPSAPYFVAALDIDASAGIDRPAKVSARHVLRGDAIYQLRTKLAALSAADAERAVKSYWKESLSFIEPESVSWRYSDNDGAVVFSITGKGKLEWEGNDSDGHTLTILGAGFYKPDELKRPPEQDPTAPWATDFPAYKCWATTIRLPKPHLQYHWGYEADPVDTRLGGVAYWRDSSMKDGVITTVMSRRTYKPEISAREAKQQNAALEAFNNSMSQVFETHSKRKIARSDVALPSAGEVDWANPSAPCASDVPLPAPAAIN